MSKIRCSEIKSFIVKSNEAILEPYLNQFTIYAFNENALTYSAKYKIFYTYLYHTKEYQISYYESTGNQTFVELESLECREKGNILFIAEHYFALFIDKEFYFYQNRIEEMCDSEIVQYVQRRLEVENCLIKYVNKTSSSALFHLNYMKKENYKHTLFWFIYIFFILCITSVVIYYDNKAFIENKNTLIKYEKQYRSLNQQTFFDAKVAQTSKVIINQINHFEVTLHAIKFQSKKFDVLITSFEKEKLSHFFNNTTLNLFNSSIEFDYTKKWYVLHAEIK